jgi:predicted RNase H-like nuclease (RuvC/YqgF family)
LKKKVEKVEKVEELNKKVEKVEKVEGVEQEGWDIAVPLACGVSPFLT